MCAEKSDNIKICENPCNLREKKRINIPADLADKRRKNKISGRKN